MARGEARFADAVGTELAVIPLAALIAARFRLGANRLRSVRKSVDSPYLTLPMVAKLVPLIARPTLFANVCYSFFGSQMQIHDPGGDGPTGLGVVLSLLGTLVRITGAVWLSRQGGIGDGVAKEEHPHFHAI